jgi:hypothetical protein
MGGGARAMVFGKLVEVGAAFMQGVHNMRKRLGWICVVSGCRPIACGESAVPENSFGDACIGAAAD